MLEGLRVVELGSFVSAPLAGMILGDLGANVIKIEPLKGESSRKISYPQINGMSGYFFSLNRNKRSISVNTDTEEGKGILRDLLKNSDVLISNLRPKALLEMGISKGGLKEINPNLIFGHITGFKENSPLANKSAFDPTILALSGLMNLTGEPSGEPLRFAIPISDIISAIMTIVGILSMSLSGKRGYVNNPMLDSLLYFMTFEAYNYLLTGKDHERMGSGHNNFVPYRAFRTKDGHIFVGAANDNQYRKLCAAMNRHDLMEYDTSSKRLKNRSKIEKEMQDMFSRGEREYWLPLLESHDVPSAPILKVSEAFNQNYVKEFKIVTNGKIDGFRGNTPFIKFPLSFEEEPQFVRTPPPELGNDTIEILKECGYDENKINALFKEGIIRKKIQKAKWQLGEFGTKAGSKKHRQA